MRRIGARSRPTWRNPALIELSSLLPGHSSCSASAFNGRDTVCSVSCRSGAPAEWLQSPTDCALMRRIRRGKHGLQQDIDQRSGAAPRSQPVKALEIAIGKQVRSQRKRLNLTVAALASQARLSTGMLSKIENGQTSPSLATLTALADALHVPVTSFFRGYEERRDVSFIRAGEGLPIQRRGSGAGHQYQLLGHTIGKPYSIEPSLVTLTDESEVFPVFQHAGTELIYLLEGQLTYRHADKTYTLRPGDTLFFDAEGTHGPEELQQLPCRFLAIIVSEAIDSPRVSPQET